MNKIIPSAIIMIAGMVASNISAEVNTICINLNDSTKYERLITDIDSIIFDYQSVSPTPIPDLATKHSSRELPNDTIWFTVPSKIALDDYAINYDFKIIETFKANTDASKNVFIHPNENAADNIVIQRNRRKVGVVYTAPDMAAKAECVLTLDNGQQQTSGIGNILVCPIVSPGFEINGERPIFSDPSPSNIKVTELFVDLAYGQTLQLGACIGVRSGIDSSIEQVQSWESADGFGWVNDNRDIVMLRNQTIDRDYMSGYVSYVTVTAGINSGVANVSYVLPGNQVLRCRINVCESN